MSLKAVELNMMSLSAQAAKAEHHGLGDLDNIFHNLGAKV